MIDDIAARFEGATVARTAVGEANVVAGMRASGAPLGGEGNGGVIVEAVGWVRDSIAAMGLVLELLASEGRSLAEPSGLRAHSADQLRAARAEALDAGERGDTSSQLSASSWGFPRRKLK